MKLRWLLPHDPANIYAVDSIEINIPTMMSEAKLAHIACAKHAKSHTEDDALDKNILLSLPSVICNAQGIKDPIAPLLLLQKHSKELVTAALSTLEHCANGDRDKNWLGMKEQLLLPLSKAKQQWLAHASNDAHASFFPM